MNKESHKKIAQEWFEAWNSRDLESILKHYDDGVEFESPFVREIMGGSNDKIKGLIMPISQLSGSQIGLQSSYQSSATTKPSEINISKIL